MVFRRPLMLAAFGALALGAVANAEPLADGRKLLQLGDVKGAAAAYGQIAPGAPQWADRLVDQIRWQILHKKALDAWRLLAVAARTRTVLPQAQLYAELSEVMARVCNHTVPDDADEPLYRLIQAYQLRFPNRFQQNSLHADPFGEAANGHLPHYLARGQTPYLDEIKHLTLFPGTGCRLTGPKVADRDKLRTAELGELQHWYTKTRPAAAPSSGQLPGAEAVELRLLDLAEYDQTDSFEELVEGLLASYQMRSASDWVKIPEPERRYLFAQLIEAELIKAPPYQDGSAEGTKVQDIILGLTTPDATSWLALLDLASFPRAKRLALIDHLLAVPEVPSRPYLLAKRAEILALNGDAPATLAMIRRLLLLGESEGDEAVERFAGDVAAQLFAEFHDDQALLGAMEHSLPVAQWGRVFRLMLLQQALVGDQKGYDRTMQSVAKDPRALRLDAEEKQMLEAMARRQWQGFVAAEQRWGHNDRPQGRQLAFVADFADRVLQLTPAERQGATPYLQRFADRVKGWVGKGGSQERLQELMALLKDPQTDAYGRGAATARQGTVAAGVVDLRRKEPLESPYVWNPPVHLPLRDLLPLPVQATARDWEIR